MVTESDTGSIKVTKSVYPSLFLHTMAVTQIHSNDVTLQHTYSRVTKSGKPATKIKYLPLFHTLYGCSTIT